MTALAPALTSLDRRILATLDPRCGRRVGTIVWEIRDAATPGEVREILRGLEALGLAHQTSGWWRRTT